MINKSQLKLILLVIWLVVGLYGILSLFQALTDWAQRGRLELDFTLISITLIGASYVGWRVSVRLLDRLFMNNEHEKENGTHNLEIDQAAFVHDKRSEYLKVLATAILGILLASVVNQYSEIASGILLFFGGISVILMAVRVYRGGKAFD